MKIMVTFRIEEEIIKELKKEAQKRNMGYQTLMRRWIIERLNVEFSKKGGIK